MTAPDLSPSLALDRLAASEGVLDGLRDAAALIDAVAIGGGPLSCEELMEVVDGDDQLAGIAAVHAISALQAPQATGALQELLDDHRWHIAEHAAWALSARPPHPPAVRALTSIVGQGGFAGMLAQRTLEGWARTADVAPVVAAALRRSSTAGVRRRLVETLGLIGFDERVLTRVALDHDEVVEVRAAAIAALGDRPGDPAVLASLRRRSDELGEHAALALIDRALAAPAASTVRSGLRVAQVYVHAELDGDPGRDGAGDHGGVATLLGLLSLELSGDPRVEAVVTVGRGRPADALAAAHATTSGSRRTWPVPFGPRSGIDQRGAWPYRVEIERGLRRALRSSVPVDLVHLRMADVGTLAAAHVARQLGVPVVFTAAPDPHAVLEAAERDGTIDRSNFGDADSLQHWWFRARMVERLIGQAAGVALLPRPGAAAELRRLGLDVPAAAKVIAEGVHAATVRHAAATVGAGTVVGELRDRLATLPERRRGLPLVLTAGRLHPGKGMDRIARAWAGDAALRAGTNLVVVGGDLEQPSPDELDVLLAIEDAVHGDTDGLVLLGHRPHLELARLFASASAGNGAIYVAGARKEEFGLAIVEAMAAGLVVVAPSTGGPSTYVDDGVDGILVDTGSVDALAAGMRAALRLVDMPGRAATTSSRILATYTIEEMAANLADLYTDVADHSRRRSPCGC